VHEFLFEHGEPWLTGSVFTTNVFPLREVLLQNPDLSQAISDQYDTPEQRDARLIRERGKVLGTLVQRFMQPAFRPDVNRIEVTTNGNLVGNFSDDQQRAWLSSFLQLQRRTDCLLDMQFRFIRGPRHAFDRFGLADSATAVLSEPDVVAILQESAKQLGDAATVTAPRMIVWPRLPSNISVIDKVAYIERWDVRIVEPGKQVIADPVIIEAPHGVTIDVTAVLLEDALFGAIVDVKQSQVKRPIPTRKIRLATPDNREVEVASPETTTVSLSATLSLRAGETALFRAPLQDDERDVAVLLSIRRVDATPELLGDPK
jgi:hypothetical protein